MVGALRKKPLGLMAYRALNWLAPGAWTTWVAAEGWSWAAALALGGGALAVGLTSEIVREIDIRTEIQRGLLLPDGRRPSRPLTPREITLKVAIDELLRLPDPGVDVLALEDWGSGSGFSALLEFPAETGYGDEELTSIVVRLARRLRLPTGCIPEVEEGELQGQVILRVPTLDDLSANIQYPADYSPLSIYDEHPLGIFGDQSVATDEMRESSKLVGGRKGGGKTNIADVYAANLMRTTDALVWDIDLNGGGMSAFWMLPYALGEVDRPPINWVAPDPDEAIRMSFVLLAIVRARKAQYTGRRARANSRLLPLSAELPAIVLRIDEVREVLGDNAPYPLLRDNILAAHRMGREAGINFVIATLRPTGEMVPVEVRKNSSTRICTRVEEDSELGYMFPQAGVKLRSRMLKSSGEAFISRGDPDAADTPVRRMKFFHLLPDRIREIVLATTGLRPWLDDFSAAVGDLPFMIGSEELSAVYSGRLDRAADWLAMLAGANPGDEDYAEYATSTREPHSAPPASTSDALAVYAQKKAAAEAARDQAADEEAKPKRIELTDEEVLDRLAGIEASLRPPVVQGPRFAAPPTASLEERVQTVAEIVRSSGESGIARREVIAMIQDRGIEVTDQTVSDWLAGARDAGLIEPTGKKGYWRASGDGA
jgi:S-DNA-T family DNA segregation ATPase FtsK/SpoIIIE